MVTAHEQAADHLCRPQRPRGSPKEHGTGLDSQVTQEQNLASLSFQPACPFLQ